MKRTLKMKVLSFALAFITAVMLFPYGTLTAYAVNEVTEADENLVNEPLIEENDTATATEPENSTSAPVEEETEIFYDEYEIENTAMSAPPMTQIGGSADPSDLGPLEPVVLPDGVYEIENVGNDNYYMTVENNYAVAGYRMVQQNYSSNTPLTNFSRSSLFKVSRIGNTNQYVIRSMLNNRMSFTTGTDIDINKFSTGYINTNDSNVNTTYTILQSGGVYTIHPYGSTSVLAAPNTTVSGENDPAAAQLILSTSSAAGNRGKWKFTAYTGNIKYGTARTQTLSMSNGLAEGKNGTVWIKGWSTVIGANTPYMSVESGYTDIAISTWDDYAGGAIVTGKKSGDFKLKAEIRSDPSTTATHTNLYTYAIIPDVVDNTAYIQNAATGKYVEIESASTSDGGIIQQCFFHTMDHMKWTFELGGSGYLRIKSLKSGKYIGVDSADTTKVKQYSAATDYTLWKFVETSRGNYKLICKATASSGKVLAVPSSTSGNYVDLTMLAYVDDTDLKDEWEIQNYSKMDTLKMNVGDILCADLTGVSHLTPCVATSFDYSVLSGSDKVSVNNSNGKFTAISTGVAIIKATHKATNKIFLFDVSIYEGSIYMRLFSSSEGGTGHSWIQFTNKTKSPIYIGACTVMSGEDITLGKFGAAKVTGVEFEGLWYNREKYFYNNGQSSYTRITSSVETAINQNDLSPINTFINSTYNTYSLVGDNCVDFAVQVWNIGSPVNITQEDVQIIASIPGNLKTYIEQHFDNYESNVPLSTPRIYGYYDGESFVNLIQQ